MSTGKRFQGCTDDGWVSFGAVKDGSSLGNAAANCNDRVRAQHVRTRQFLIVSNLIPSGFRFGLGQAHNECTRWFAG